MMKGWTTQPMGRLCSIKNGKSNSEDAIEDAPYAFFDRSKKIKRSTKYLFDCEALIIPGEGAEFLPRHYEGKFDLHQRAYALYDFREAIDTKYLYYFLIHSKDYWPRVAVGATVKSLRLRHFEDLPISHPPLPEQQRIVGKMDAAFAALGEAQALVERNRANARELFESYLNGVFERKGDGWVEKTLAEVCTLRSGTTLPPEVEKEDGELAYLKVADMSVKGNERVVTTSSRFVDHSIIRANNVFPIGTTIFPKRGGAILTNKKRLTSVEIVADLNIMGLTPNDELLPEFLFNYFLQLDLRDINNGSSIPQINNYSIEPLLIGFPSSKKEQRRIVEKLESLYQESTRLETTYQQKLSDLDALKKGLLGAAFRGEL